MTTQPALCDCGVLAMSRCNGCNGARCATHAARWRTDCSYCQHAADQARAAAQSLRQESSKALDSLTNANLYAEFLKTCNPPIRKIMQAHNTRSVFLGIGSRVKEEQFSVGPAALLGVAVQSSEKGDGTFYQVWIRRSDRDFMLLRTSSLQRHGGLRPTIATGTKMQRGHFKVPWFRLPSSKVRAALINAITDEGDRDAAERIKILGLHRSHGGQWILNQNLPPA